LLPLHSISGYTRPVNGFMQIWERLGTFGNVLGKKIELGAYTYIYSANSILYLHQQLR